MILLHVDFGYILQFKLIFKKIYTFHSLLGLKCKYFPPSPLYAGFPLETPSCSYVPKILEWYVLVNPVEEIVNRSQQLAGAKNEL